MDAIALPAPLRATCLLLAAGVLLAPGGCASPYYADRGAALGGIGGALAGAAIGNKSGNALAGSVIGAATGALAGGAIGDAIDEDMAHRQAVIESHLGRQVIGLVTPEDVVAMTGAGVPEEVIVGHVRASGVAAHPSSDDLIRLHQAGVSGNVIAAMQSAPIGGPPVRQAAPPSRPVVIERYDVYEPPYFYDPWHCPPYYRHHHRGFRGGVTIWR